ncbi:hypothetical protein [Pseudomonas syringae group genomosp. 7]|uniref:hypothetical protein n=1 Tax=Pseudomonas syringae group genomosp. 7 TaxID=251699 RepID=UPI00377033A2
MGFFRKPGRWGVGGCVLGVCGCFGCFCVWLVFFFGCCCVCWGFLFWFWFWFGGGVWLFGCCFWGCVV